jgi:hypothetical protein
VWQSCSTCIISSARSTCLLIILLEAPMISKCYLSNCILVHHRDICFQNSRSYGQFHHLE